MRIKSYLFWYKLGDQWSIWLPESALETFRYGGYYVVLLYILCYLLF